MKWISVIKNRNVMNIRYDFFLRIVYAQLRQPQKKHDYDGFSHFHRVFLFSNLTVSLFPGKIFYLKRPRLSNAPKTRTITPSSWPGRGVGNWAGCQYRILKKWYQRKALMTMIQTMIHKKCGTIFSKIHQKITANFFFNSLFFVSDLILKILVFCHFIIFNALLVTFCIDRYVTW